MGREGKQVGLFEKFHWALNRLFPVVGCLALGGGGSIVAQSVRAQLRKRCRHGLLIGWFACEIHIPGRQFAISRNQRTLGVPPPESARPMISEHQKREGMVSMLLC